MQCDIRTRRRNSISELVITASAPVTADPADIVTAVWGELRAVGAAILLERWFGPRDVQPHVMTQRHLHATAGDALPAWLAPPHNRQTQFIGVTILAVAGLAKPNHPAPGVRAFSDGSSLTWVTIQGVACQDLASAWTDLGAKLVAAQSDPRHLVRTWLWLHRILDHYDELNHTRTNWFRTHGLIGEHRTTQHMPASTAVGVDPTQRMAFDAIAIRSGNGPTLFAASGNQRSAFAYGSAFARAAMLEGFTGSWLTISGTAAIDVDGRTTHAGDPVGQIDDALANIQAVWRQHGCSDQQVVQAIAYCTTEAVADHWRARAAALPWPCLTVMADICRADLAFEIEALVDMPPLHATAV